MRPPTSRPSLLAVADTPPSASGLQAALDLTGDTPVLLSRGRDLADLVETTFGLRVGQVRVLDAIGEGVTSVEDLARSIGEHPDATQATITTLQTAALVELDGDDEATLTEAGRVKHDQVVAFTLRLTARVADEVDIPALGSAKAAIRRLRAAGGPGEPPPQHPAA